VAARYGGSYITHMRDEGDDNSIGIDAAMEEVFRIAREVPIPAEIYHIKASGRRSWGRMPEMLAKIERARVEGLDVSADQYPWAASSNNLDASLPVWVREGGAERMVARLGDPETRKKARADFLALPENEDWPAGAARILVTSVLNPELKHYEGMTIEQIAKERSIDPLEALMDLVVADRGSTARVTFGMSEEDVRAALRHPLVSFCTDSGARAEDGIFSKQKTHPRAFGSATRILGHYVRDQKVLPLEEAVRKMTSLPAVRMHIHDRGVLRPGLAADVVAFDPETVRERSTFADPLHYSEGVPYVMVNGRLVVDEGKITDARPGRVLRGPGYRRLPGR
jgi:N-acyl-D-aspartate/D-glutamate deacylase